MNNIRLITALAMQLSDELAALKETIKQMEQDYILVRKKSINIKQTNDNGQKSMD